MLRRFTSWFVPLLLAVSVMEGVQFAKAPEAARAHADASTGTAGMFVPLQARLMDTRDGTGGYSTPMPANSVRAITAGGVGGVPTTNVRALALTLTVVGVPTIGAISVGPGDGGTPANAALVFNPGESVSNTAMVGLHSDGKLKVVSDHSNVNLIVDVQGYFTDGDTTADGGFVPLVCV
jgi:hypothetical protein